MVPRSELYTAQAEVKSSREEAEALARDVESLHQQFTRAREQCTMEQATISEMVPRSELAAAKAREEEAAALARSAHERHREAAIKLEARLSGMEEELDQLRATLKVRDRLICCTERTLGCDAFSLQGLVPRADLELARYGSSRFLP
jgi:polyhydroxyalkanoate synthesis regulator phasin